MGDLYYVVVTEKGIFSATYKMFKLEFKIRRDTVSRVLGWTHLREMVEIQSYKSCKKTMIDLERKLLLKF